LRQPSLPRSWHAEEHECPAFLHGQALSPLSRKHMNLLDLHLQTVVLSLNGFSDACINSLSSCCSIVNDVDASIPGPWRVRK
jgi:hypothetical protein